MRAASSSLLVVASAALRRLGTISYDAGGCGGVCVAVLLEKQRKKRRRHRRKEQPLGRLPPITRAACLSRQEAILFGGINQSGGYSLHYERC
ncbi:unnamed protein product [Linum trigynum]|uniref:Secreted protein n=1 Tax=Linum trigynum TaxID=586398 RepID=A0AAV2CJP2_9ROSI